MLFSLLKGPEASLMRGKASSGTEEAAFLRSGRLAQPHMADRKIMRNKGRGLIMAKKPGLD